jgi:ABC-type polysaccharide/polyol phosphate export permease
MSDAFLNEMKDHWQSIAIDPQDDRFERLKTRVRRRRTLSLLWIVLELLTTMSCIYAGLYMLQQGGLLAWLTAGVLVLVIPGMFIWSFMTQRSNLHLEEQSPTGYLQAEHRNLLTSLKVLRIMKAHCWGLAGFVLLLWLLEIAGLLGAVDFMLLYTALTILVVTIVGLILRRRRPRLKARLVQCEKLLKELDS